MSLKNKKLILIICLIFFVLLIFSVTINYKPLLSFDKSAQTFSSTLHSPLLDQTMLSVTKIGNTYESLLIFIVFAFFIISKRRKYPFYFFTIVTALGTLLPELLKNLIERARPISNILIETGYSFPSGHATISTVFFFSSIFIISPHIKNNFSKITFITCTSIIFPLVAISRVYLSVHWISDVLGGILLGSICYILTSIFCCHKKENML
ncbi:MAG: phosphatase PAP2 family protein [Candidatus Paceibacterota bacterium]|jgi:undecaprenyl-diphosphatase